MAKQLNVNLGFTADTSQAKAQLQELQNALIKLTQTSASKTSGLGLTKEINDAINAVTELQVKLQQSTTSTGTLDLGKFNQSLQQGGKKLSDYANQLKVLGPEGQAAFSKLARSISLAEVPLKRSNKLLSEFATTMKNTVRWQLSSSMLHGFMGAIQSAYRYSQDLNESLNNIRIVTGASIDEMDKFAEKANKAARALSATTTEYTDAALIFYQQGLNDDQVEERTNATIKMAHAAGESATEVSSYMTAVWNNFADGSKSLEYYGDVMTKLGAETAASSAEIAEGLEKFAAIGETVGLSYEYAASAIATVVDKTRQSADTVGTAFKTIFARLQGLKLGETLDDGTDLNKYSAALMSVGISIKDVQGNLKDTDIILDELGAKWKTLARDEQTALAQTVAGTRQYTQLMALMNNYDAFKENVATAEGSTGTLDKQSRIYAESWEAARDRVTAAAEQIYEALLDDKVFIGILNVVEKLVSGFGNLIDIMGGLKGVLPLVATLMLKSFGPDIANSIDRVFYNIKLGSEKGRQEIYNLRKESADTLKTMYDDGTESGSAMYDVGSKQADLQNTLLDKTLQLQQANKELTEEEQKQAQQLLDINASLSDQYIQLTKNKEQMSEASGDLEKKALAKMGKKGEQFDISSLDGKKTYKGKNGFSEAIKEAGQLQNTYRQGQKIVKAYSKEVENLVKSNDNSSETFENLKKRVENLNKSMDALGDVTPEVADAIKELNKAAQAGDLEKMQEVLNGLNTASENAGADAYEMFELIRQGAQNAGVNMKQFNPILDQIQTSFEATGALTADQIQLFTNLGFQVDEAGKIIGGFSGKVATIGDAVSATTSAVTSYGMALSQASAFGENLFDPDIGPLEKLISLMMLAGTVVRAYNDINHAGKIIEEAVAGAKARKAAASAAAAAAQGVETTAIKAGTVATNENTVAINTNKLALLSHPILGGIAVALMVVVAAISAVSAKIKANSEEIAENAEKSREQAAASKEVFDANQDLINSYEQARQAYAEDESAKDDLISISQDLCDQLDIEGAALMRAKGDYDALTEAIYKNQKAKIDTALQDNQRAKNDTSKEFVDNMREDVGRFSGNSYIADIGTMWQSIDDETIVSDAISSLGDEVSHITDNIVWDGTIQVKTGQSTAEIRQAYEEVLAVVEEVERIAGDDTELLNNSENYQAMLDWLDKSKDSYEALIALENEEAELRTAQIVNDAVANGQSLSTLEEYKALRSQVVSDLQTEVGLTEEQANSIADTYLKQSAAVSELAESYSVLKDASKISGISEDDLSEWYNTLDEDEQKLFATLNFDSARSVEELEGQLDVLQARANRTSIQTKLEVVEDAKESLKSNMSADDYEEYQTKSGIDWGNAEEGIIEYSKFLTLSYDNQVAYLEGLSERYSSELNAATDESIAQNEQRIEELNGLISSADDELTQLETTLSTTNIQLEIDENGTLATDISQITNEILKLNNLDVESNEYTELLEKLKNSGIDEATIQSYLDANQVATGYREEIEYLNNEIDELQEQEKVDNILDTKESLGEAENLDDLQARWGRALQEAGNEGIDYSVYSEALITLAENYDNCTQEIEKYQEALKSGNKAQIEIAEDALKAAVIIGEASEKYGFDAEVLEAQAKRLGKAYDLSAEEAAKLAIKNQRMNKGVSSLVDNWSDWKKQLKSSNKLTEDYSEAIVDCTAAIADLVGASEDLELPDEFFNDENMKLIEQAMKGDTKAINQLGAEVAKTTVEALEFNSSFADLINQLETWDGQVPDITLNTAQFDADKATVLAGIEDIKNGITTAGAVMDGEWVAALNRMALTTGMSVQEMNGLLGSLGVQAKVETTYVEQPMEVPTYIEHVVPQAPVTVQQGEDANGNPNMVTYTPVQKYSVPGKPMQVTGFAAVAQISTEDNPMTAKVTSNTVKGGGAPAASYSGNRGSVAPSATKGSGGKKGGGGGGNTPEAKDHVDYDPRERKKSGEEIERYREINNLLENLARKLDKVSEAKSRAFGKNKIALMREEAKLLREQVALEQQKQQEILANLKNDKSKIKSNYGATFDEDGNVNNYDEMVQAQVDKYNAAYDAYIKAQNNAVNIYNASGRGDADEQAYEDRIKAAERTWKVAQDAYDQFTEDLDQYDETYDLFEESKNTLDDIQNQLYDLDLEEVEYKVQLKLDIEDDQMKVLDFLLGNLEDNAHDAAEAIAILTQQTESAMNNLATYEQGINDIFANHGLGSNAITQFLNGILTADDLANMDFTETEVEKLREYRDGLLDETQNLIDYENAIREKVLTAWDDLVSKMDQGIEKLDHLTSMTESYKNIVDIVGKDMLGISDELIKSLDQATYDTALNKLEATSSKLDAMRASRQEAEDALAQARLEGNEDLIQYWEDTIATMDSEIDSAEEEFMSSWEESLQAAADMFANETEAIINEFSEKMAGAFGGTLEELQNAFSKQREINDLYVDDYKKIYELSKLSRDISKSVDETDNLAGKKALLAIQEEINKAQAEGVEMSEYEIENLRRKYDLELAKMQLDEAKNTKSTVRMTRDNNGNWGYVYTADQDGVAAAEQNYEDKLYAMQEANSEYIKELEANIIQAEINMTEAMREIDATQYANAEEYYKACEEVAKPYYEMMEFYTNQMNLALGNNKQLYNGDWKEYSISTGYKISANKDFMDSFSETLLGQMTGYRSAEGYLQAHIEAVGSVDNPESLLGKLGTAYNGYSAKVDAAMEAAGTSTKNFAEHLDGYVNDEENGIAANAKKASSSVEKAGKDMKDAMDKVIGDVTNFSSKYGSKIQAIISKNTQLANSLNSVIAKWSELNGEENGGGTTNTTPTTPTTTPNTNPTKTPTTPSTPENTRSNSGSGDGLLSVGDIVTYTGGKYYADSYGGGASGNRGPGKKVTVTAIKSGRPYPIHVQSSNSAYGWLKKSQLSGFDTGGYTGVWGDQMGRLALLHQKELVLNENETKDMLQMIEMVREISSMIDLNAMSASQGLTGYLSSGKFNDGMMTIQQEVTIHAEFPDVSDKNEIKEAFGDLINMAAQYANRVK